MFARAVCKFERPPPAFTPPTLSHDELMGALADVEHGAQLDFCDLFEVRLCLFELKHVTPNEPTTLFVTVALFLAPCYSSGLRGNV